MNQKERRNSMDYSRREHGVAESLGLETEDHQDGKEGLDSWVTKTRRRDALAFNIGCLLQLLEALLPNAAVVG